MRRLIVFLLVLFTVVSISAEDNTAGLTIGSQYLEVQPVLIGGSEATKTTIINPFAGAWDFYLKIIVVVGGALMLLRFAVELVEAIVFKSEGGDSAKLKEVFYRFIVVISIVMVSFGIIAIFF
jgi:hypothetical protein